MRTEQCACRETQFFILWYREVACRASRAKVRMLGGSETSGRPDKRPVDLVKTGGAKFHHFV